MKDTKTVSSTVNANGDNKNGFHHKNKSLENGSSDEQIITTATAATTITTTLIKDNINSEELVGGCCVCSDDQGFANNALVYCDGKGCTVACHTACYGIVSIPDGDWYCGRCEAGDVRAMCRLCPTVEGAMKKTSDGGWAHVVCALYIPEVSFGDNSTMEPIILSKIPSTRFGQECSICVQNGRSKVIATNGACCGCTAKNCSQVFHVTCAQANGLLCEDVRKNNCQYPIYCEQHRPKLSKFIRQVPSFQYSAKSLATIEQLKKQHLFSKEKENPSQLSDFIASTVTETTATEPDTSTGLTEKKVTTDEQQTSTSRTSSTADTLPRKHLSISSVSSSVSPSLQQSSYSRSSSTSSSSNLSSNKTNNNNNNDGSLNNLTHFVRLNKEDGSSHKNRQTIDTIQSNSSISHREETTFDNSKTVAANLEQQSSSSSIEEKSLAARCSTSSIQDNENKIHVKQRHSTDVSSTTIKSNSLKKSIMKMKDDDRDDDRDEDYEVHKKHKLLNKLNKNGKTSKKRQHSAEGGPRPVGRPPSRKRLLTQQTNSPKRPLVKSTMNNNNNNNNNMKSQTANDTLINVRDSSKIESNVEKKLKSHPVNYYPCDHLGNRINPNALVQREDLDEQLGRISRTETNETSSLSHTQPLQRIAFYPRRPLQNRSSSVTTSEQQQQRTFPPQTLEEFLEQEWELSSDFLLQQTMPHDVSSLLSCLYQFKSENAALEKRFDELKHRRDTLRVTNANLRRRLSEILPINEAITTTSTTSLPPTITTTAATTTAVTYVSPPIASTALSVVPPSPRKEQQQLKQQKLLAELELQQQLQQQKATSPTRKHPSSQHTDSPLQTIKKIKSPRQSTSVTPQSILESQLRQSPNSITNNNVNTTMTKKSNTTSTVNNGNNNKTSLSDVDSASHNQPSSSSTTTVTTKPTPTNISTTPLEPMDVATAAAATYALVKAGRPATNQAFSIELLSQILAAGSGAMSPQLFAPTWNISNYGYANFPGTNPLPSTDESFLRSCASSSLEQQPQASSTKQQP